MFVKLGLQLDPFDNYDIEFHQACNTKTSMIGDQKGFSLSNYCDLGNEYDYSNWTSGLLLPKRLEKIVLLILTFVIIKKVNTET